MTTEQKWKLVLSRDVNADGKFFYAVRSTGVYCRPSCPSRRPRRDYVEFFSTTDAAERAGYRACARCRPGEISRQLRAVQLACRYIEGNLEEKVPLSKVAAFVGMSSFHLLRVFKRRLGITPREYRQARRLERFKSAVNAKNTVTTALYEAGYGSTSRLYENSNRQLGMTPRTYRNGAAGTHIGYTVFDTPLGKTLLAATERGVCAIRFGDASADLVEELKSEFPAAELLRDQPQTQAFADAVRRHLDGTAPDLNLPLDIKGTAFQAMVWNALRSIPLGETRSYAQVARSIGHGHAVRAVAHACAQNPVAVAIPCHRVVHTDGSISGYRWGVARKAKLLKIEKKSGDRLIR